MTRCPRIVRISELMSAAPVTIDLGVFMFWTRSQFVTEYLLRLRSQFATLNIYFLLCTFAATFSRSAFSRMKPVASS